jgi:hypothetical protein
MVQVVTLVPFGSTFTSCAGFLSTAGDPANAILTAVVPIL